MNMKIGIMNIQIQLQIKRLQLCPCPLCVFHTNIERGTLLGEAFISTAGFGEGTQSIYSKYAQHEYCVYLWEKDDSGNLQLGSSSFSYCLRKELKKKAYSDKFFSMDF